MRSKLSFRHERGSGLLLLNRPRTEGLTLPALLFCCLARLIPLVTGGLLLGQGSRLALGLLGGGPCRQLRGLPFGLLGERGGTGRLLGQFGFMRPLRGFPLSGASGSFREHGFSCRPTLYDRRIVGARAGAEFLQHRLFCLRGGVLAFLQIGEHVPSHFRISFPLVQKGAGP